MTMETGNLPKTADDKAPKPGAWARARTTLTLAGRYLGVGAIVTGVDYALFIVSVRLGLAAVEANALSRVIATLVGAVLHRHYTFAGPQKWGLWRQMAGYGALSALNLALSSGLLIVLVDRWGWAPLLSKVCTDVLIIAVSIIVGRLLIFAPAPTKSP